MQGYSAKYYHHLNRLAMAFALIVDIGLISLGAAIKRKEYLSGRYADALAWLYISSAVLKRFHDENDDIASQPLLDWSLTLALHNIEKALMEILQNLPNRFLACFVKLLAFPTGFTYPAPSDKHNEALVKNLMDQEFNLRDKITGDIHLPPPGSEGLGILETALTKITAASAARKAVDRAKKSGLIAKEDITSMAQKAVEQKIITSDEYSLILEAEEIRDAVVKVSDF